MAGYSPLYIKKYETGLVQNRQEFILPDDAYPILENAYVFRETLRRKQAYRLLGRLSRSVQQIIINVVNAGLTTYTFTNFLFTDLGLTGQANAQIRPGGLLISFSDPDAATFQDDGAGGFIVTGNGLALGSSVNYSTGDITLNFVSPTNGGGFANTTTTYFPNLPVMGLRSEELNAINNERLIAFDQKYAYQFLTGSWQEFIPGTTWTGNDSDFFWSTNYWTLGNLKLFWVTNFSAIDPIRYTDGNTWTPFAPQINAAGTSSLFKCLCLLPFRGRLLAFNTFEGLTANGIAGSEQQFQRIRWAQIGNPIPNGAYQPWVDDIRGRGNFLDIPTSQSIVSVGFVRDNLVIYCERSTWQLRYTGRSIAPFQIEKVNSELGAESTFSAVQFDTSLFGIGDKGIVECDSYKSERVDIKIPDLVYSFQNENNGTKRVHGIRNQQKRLAFWTYPLASNEGTFPDRRLVYNYENDSWAIYTDSLTTFGTYQSQTNLRWIDFATDVDSNTWQAQNYSWVDKPALFPSIVGGNQQGFVEILDTTTTNDVSLYISNIIGNTITPTVIVSPNHNLEDNDIIKINNIPAGTPFATSLNGNVFRIERGDITFSNKSNQFRLFVYNPSTGQFNTPQLDDPDVYIGGGQIAVRDNFSITSKKFNFLDEGQNIQMGYLDILMDSTQLGALSLNVYLDYNNNSPVNIFPENQSLLGGDGDTFFNSVVPTTYQGGIEGLKYWQRVFCPVRGAFITLEWTLNNEQMTNNCQESDVQIDAQILWIRRAGKQLNLTE